MRGKTTTNLHGPKHHDRQRSVTIWMLWTALAQFVAWMVLLVGAFVSPTLRAIFQKVFWVSVLSLYANLMTVGSIVAGSWAALAAGRAHEDVEHTRSVLTADLEEIRNDLGRLADLPPGVEARQLARRIGDRLNGGPR